MAKKAAIYARYSSDNQRDESIDAQVRAIEEYAARNDLQVVHQYIDRAKSATSDKRPEFQKMIEDSSLGIFEVVIIHKLDRFSRDKYDSAKYKHKLKLNDIQLISVTENLDGSPESVILESLLEGMAQYYSANLSREVMKGLKENAYQCKHTGGCPPFGYNLDVDNGYIANEKEAEAVRLIFTMYDNGYSYLDIIKKLNMLGIKTKANKSFGKNSLSSILRNEKYSGVYIFNRASKKDAAGKRNSHKRKPDEEIIMIEGGMPQIVSKELFKKVQEKMELRKMAPGSNKAKVQYLLSGLIKCGECGYSMNGNSRVCNNKPPYVSYRCGCRLKKHECSNKEIRKESVEQYVLTELEKHILNNDAIPIIAKKLNENIKGTMESEINQIRYLQDELKKVDEQMDRIITLLMEGFAQDAFKTKLTELETRKKEIDIEIIRLESCHNGEVIVSEEQIKAMLSHFKEYVLTRNIPECKSFLHNFVKEVVVYQDHIEVIFNVVFSFSGKNSTYDKKVIINRSHIYRIINKIA